MIYIYTHAYNASKTLPRAIESVRNQTNGDFVWYLCDNASTDDTREIILRYAEKDKRIIPELRDMNHLHPDYKGISLFWLPVLMSICEKGNDDDFFCTLDADDEYMPDFFEKLLCFMDENALEVAACGNDFIDAATGLIARQRALPQNLILDSVKKSDVHFPAYHQFMRTVWGKLYRLSLLKKCDYEDYFNPVKIPYGLDTLFCMRAFSRAGRAGVFAEPLHKYYLSASSSSYSFDNRRIISDQILDDETREMLVGKAGKISPENDGFLKHVYFNAVADTLSILLKSEISTAEKISYTREIIHNGKTQALFSSSRLEQYGLNEKVRVPVTQYLLSQKECRKPDKAEAAAEIIMAMYGELQQLVSQDGLAYILIKMPEMVEYLLQKDYERILERLCAWFKRHDADVPSLTELEISAFTASGKSDDEIFMRLIDVKKNRLQASKTLDIDTRICELIQTYPLLRNMSADLAVAAPHAIRWVMKNDYQKALGAVVSGQDTEIKDSDAETYILFGQNLSAAAENTGAYIFFKKVWISYLIDCSRAEEASKELDEYNPLLPGDKDFIALRKRLEQK